MNTAILERDLHVGFASSSSSGAGVFEGQHARAHLFGPLVPGWKLKYPLPIRVEREAGGRFVVSDDIFNVYGVGGSWDAGVSDYKVALVEFFEITNESDDDQSRRVLEHLEAYLRRA